MEPAAFEIDRAVSSMRGPDGAHELTVTSDWNTPNGTPNGGYVLALVLNAVVEESPLPDPLSVSVTYFRPPATGAATVEVTPLRLGRRVATFAAVLRQGDADVVHAVVSLHDADATGDIQHPSPPPPSIAAPDDCHDLMAEVPLEGAPILGRFDYRHETVPGWMTGHPSGDMSATFWVRPKDGRPVDALAAAMLVDAYPPVTTEIGQIKSATVQLTVHLRRRPSTGWALAHVVTRHVIDGYHEEDVELWDEQGRLIAQSRQLALLH
jgi:acyl-CoA thioesterase